MEKRKPSKQTNEPASTDGKRPRRDTADMALPQSATMLYNKDLMAVEEYGKRVMKAVTKGEKRVPSISEYEFIEQIGESAQGAVFVARQISSCGIRKRVAIKVLKEDRSQQDLERFVEEASMLSHLTQGTIVELLALERMDVVLPAKARVGGAETKGKQTLFFMVQELVDGPSLRRVMDMHFDNTLLMHPAVVGFALNRAAIALDEAHTLIGEDGNPLQLIHRNLGPSDILFNAKTGVVKLSDFGMSVMFSPVETFRLLKPSPAGEEGKLKVKPFYMAPEQFEGKSCAASDIWALGVVGYEAVTGVLPYQLTEETVPQLVASFANQLQYPLRSPSEVRRCYDRKFNFEALSDIIMRCLRPDPQERPTAREVNDMLEGRYLYGGGLGPTGKTAATYIRLLKQAIGMEGGVHPSKYEISPEAATLMTTLGVASPWDAIRRRTVEEYRAEFVAAVKDKEANPCLRHGPNGPYVRR